MIVEDGDSGDSFVVGDDVGDERQTTDEVSVPPPPPRPQANNTIHELQVISIAISYLLKQV